MFKRNPKLDEKAVTALARRVLRRVHALGAKTVEIEDVKGELWVAWCIACERYDVESGVPFGAYLATGMRNHINRWVDKSFERFHAETIAASIEAPQGDDEGMTLESIIPDDKRTQDSILEKSDFFEEVYWRLSERAQLFVRILVDTPPELTEEIKALEAKAEHAQALGVCCVKPVKGATNVMFDFMSAGQCERARIAREIRNVTRIVGELK